MIQKFIIHFSVLFSFIMGLTWKTSINYQCTNQILAKSLVLSVSLQSDWDKNKIKLQ